MTRWIISTCFILAGLLSFAGKLESLPVNYFYVASDVMNDSVPKGKCKVKGIVTEGYSELPVAGGLVSNFDRTSYAITNEKGEYEMLISAKDTALFFFKKNYKELVCWSYPFKSQHVVTMNFVTSEKLPEGMMIMEEKPVIYLYSPSDIKVAIKLDEKIDLTTSYPAYKDGWNVELSTINGISIEGKEYPYLFWEGQTSELNFQKTSTGLEGFVINTDTTVAFLENKLQSLGLNSTETTDFLTYWGPRMMSQSFAFVQFLVDENCDQAIGELIVTPQPETQRRVYMLFQGFNENPNLSNVTPQTLESFHRKGFTLVEWGGSELNPQQGLWFPDIQRQGEYSPEQSSVSISQISFPIAF